MFQRMCFVLLCVMTQGDDNECLSFFLGLWWAEWTSTAFMVCETSSLQQSEEAVSAGKALAALYLD